MDSKRGRDPEEALASSSSSFWITRRPPRSTGGRVGSFIFMTVPTRGARKPEVREALPWGPQDAAEAALRGA